ncbi:MAG: ComF family protein [Candidatus Binatia bacterium]
MSFPAPGLFWSQDTIGEALRAIAGRVFDRIFPWSCTSCGKEGDSPFCGPCLGNVRWTGEPQCPCCGLPFASPPSHLCGRCVAKHPSFRRARAIACYRARDEEDDPLGAALRLLKYAARRGLAGPLSELLAERFPYDPADFDLVVPVPLHLTRLRERGFNQALLLARTPARRFGLRLDGEALVRTKPTASQVGLSEGERRRNLVGAISVRRAHSVAGLRVLLVDDVCTTAATAEASARALRRAGALAVDVLTVARTLLH